VFGVLLAVHRPGHPRHCAQPGHAVRDGLIRVLPPDPFDLDRNNDGLGCETGRTRTALTFPGPSGHGSRPWQSSLINEEGQAGSSGGCGNAIIHADWTHSLVGALVLASVSDWPPPARQAGGRCAARSPLSPRPLRRTPAPPGRAVGIEAPTAWRRWFARPRPTTPGKSPSATLAPHALRPADNGPTRPSPAPSQESTHDVSNAAALYGHTRTPSTAQQHCRDAF